jgi:DHA1 family bicyclomycin/chloramphenicol resistance-like MFS transporter
VIGLIIGNFINGRLVMRFGHRPMLTAGVIVMACATTFMLTLVSMGIREQWIITPVLFIALATVGIIAANTVAGLLDRHPHHAGAASALFGLAQFGLGALSALVIGLLTLGPLLGMSIVMAGAAAMALCCVVAIHQLIDRPVMAV